jgi:hypothetical protein
MFFVYHRYESDIYAYAGERQYEEEISVPKIVLPHYCSFFIPQELEMIKKAAERNKCFEEDFIILLAIRKSENGSKGNEFGIKCPKHINTDLDGQAACAAVTIINTKKRWKKEDMPGDFITYLGRQYCPADIYNWTRNVRYFYEKFRS